MTFAGDPYRTLGIAPGASVNEIKAAYRRMAKRYHPDAAGERALPRFLAIQAAYEQLVDSNGELRRRGWTASSGAGQARPTPKRPAEPWKADPSRARASRDAWRERRTGAAGGESASTGGASSSGAGTSAGSGQATGAGGSSRRSSDGHGEHHHRRYRRKATPGSTTYDEAAEAPLDPPWDGGTWYGASSGTYWTINPREYADPRKHGPEYQRRARRAIRGEADEGGADDRGADGGADAGPDDGDGRRVPPPPDGEPWAWRPAEAAPGAADAPATGTGTAAPAAASPAAATPAASARPSAPPVPSSTAGQRSLDLTPVLPERLLARTAGSDLGWRIALAALAAAPVPLVAWTLLGEIAGCSAGAACPPFVPLLALVAWPFAAIVLAAIPAAAALGAFAAAVAGLAVLLTAAIVAAVQGDLAGALATSVGTVGVIVYCFALVMAGIRLAGRPGPEATPPPP